MTVPVKFPASLLVALGFLAGGHGSAHAEEPGFPITVTAAENLIHSISLKSAGPLTVAAWVESPAAQSDRIHFLSFGDGALDALPEIGVIAASDQTGLISNLDMDVHPTTGQPAFTWVGDGEEGTRIYFARAGQSPRVVFASSGAIEFPVLEFDGNGQAYLAWFETVNARSRVYLAREDSGGGWGAFPVSQGDFSHDLLPQLFALDSGVELYWFSVLGGDTLTRRAVYTPAGLEYSSTPFEHIPLNRWPVFYLPGGAASIGAYWLEQTAAGELYLDLDPRLSPVPVPLRQAPVAVAQVSVSDDAHAAKAWLEYTPGIGGVLHAERVASSTVIRVPKTSPILESAVSASDELLNLLWLEEDLASGLLLLRFQRAR